MGVPSQEWIASEPKWILFECLRKSFKNPSVQVPDAERSGVNMHVE